MCGRFRLLELPDITGLGLHFVLLMVSSVKRIANFSMNLEIVRRIVESMGACNGIKKNECYCLVDKVG